MAHSLSPTPLGLKRRIGLLALLALGDHFESACQNQAFVSGRNRTLLSGAYMFAARESDNRKPDREKRGSPHCGRATRTTKPDSGDRYSTSKSNPETVPKNRLYRLWAQSFTVFCGVLGLR
jgi:hypothetical protein